MKCEVEFTAFVGVVKSLLESRVDDDGKGAREQGEVGESCGDLG